MTVLSSYYSDIKDVRCVVILITSYIKKDDLSTLFCSLQFLEICHTRKDVSTYNKPSIWSTCVMVDDDISVG